MLIVAIMAGYRNRKHDPPPGHQKIWQGYSCLALSGIRESGGNKKIRTVPPSIPSRTGYVMTGQGKPYARNGEKVTEFVEVRACKRRCRRPRYRSNMFVCTEAGGGRSAGTAAVREHGPERPGF